MKFRKENRVLAEWLNSYNVFILIDRRVQQPSDLRTLNLGRRLRSNPGSSPCSLQMLYLEFHQWFRTHRFQWSGDWIHDPISLSSPMSGCFPSAPWSAEQLQLPSTSFQLVLPFYDCVCTRANIYVFKFSPYPCARCPDLAQEDCRRHQSQMAYESELSRKYPRKFCGALSVYCRCSSQARLFALDCWVISAGQQRHLKRGQCQSPETILKYAGQITLGAYLKKPGLTLGSPELRINAL